jgi:hypothetical protein
MCSAGRNCRDLNLERAPKQRNSCGGQSADGEQLRYRAPTTLIQGTAHIRASNNGEVEGPDDHVSQARLARNIDRVQPRPTTHASRPPPTMVSRHAGER